MTTTTTLPVAPERSVEQRLSALRRANEIRTYRAGLKLQVKAGETRVADLLRRPPSEIDTMKVFDLLMATPKYGRVKVQKLLGRARISPSKTVGGLSGRQRSELVLWLS